MVELFLNNEYIEMHKENISYSIRVNDLFDVSKVDASYTNEFRIPKNEHNTKAFEGLGLVGDTSSIPYKRIAANLTKDGCLVIKNAWLNIRETNSDYITALVDGIIDFFKEIENKTIGKNLDLSEINHVKDLETVANSFANDNYKYIIADYGGRTQLNKGINIDYLTPSARIAYLWDKIFKTFGFSYSGSIFQNEDFKNLWMTYPKSIEIQEGGIPSGLLSLDPFTKENPSYDKYGDTFYFNYNDFIDTDLTGFTRINQNTFRINETRQYKLKMNLSGRVYYTRRGKQELDCYYLRIKHRGRDYDFNSAFRPEHNPEKELSLKVEKGEELSFFYIGKKDNSYAVINTRNNKLEVNFVENSFGEIDFSEALADFTIKEFVKEIILRFAITPVINKETKNIEFFTVEEKLNPDNAIDWTEKYITRTKESYQNSYAKENTFNHKYNDQEDSFNDGSLSISNANLPDKKVLFTSKIYSPERGVSELTPKLRGQVFNTRIFPTWKAEVKEDTENNLVVDYKGLSGRFYFLKPIAINDEIVLQSEALNERLSPIRNFPLASSVNTTFAELVPKYYEGYKRILDDFRVHEIQLNVTLTDIVNLSFTNLYYFEQEAGYYLLNTLNWNSNGISVGEFIRVKKY